MKSTIHPEEPHRLEEAEGSKQGFDRTEVRRSGNSDIPLLGRLRYGFRLNVPDRMVNQLRCGAEIQFFLDMYPVRVNRFWAEMQCLRYLAGRIASSDHFEYLQPALHTTHWHWPA